MLLFRRITFIVDVSPYTTDRKKLYLSVLYDISSMKLRSSDVIRFEYNQVENFDFFETSVREYRYFLKNA